MGTKRLIVRGRVQGVGFRAWAMEEAERAGLSGWVRNRVDGSVELLIDGEVDAVEEMVRACRRGPRPASIASVHEELADPPQTEGFLIRPTA